MKRTALQRVKALQAKTQLRRTSALRARRRRKRRESAWRSPKYLAWVRSLPCVMCGRPADDAHHLVGIGHFGGMGTKASDELTMPVCREHHDEIHRTSELWPEQEQWVARTQDLARRNGWRLPLNHQSDDQGGHDGIDYREHQA